MGPLAGVRVIEVTNLAPVPFGCMILADLGAEVLRIDRAHKGFEDGSPAGPLDRGKVGLPLDLRTEEGVSALLDLADHADVIVEGFRPGVAERLGIGPLEVMVRNPRIVYGRLTGWGRDGPLATTAGHDINYIAMSGALDLIGRAGERPVPPGNLVGDFAGGGMLLALGVVAALVESQQSGVGQVVDAAMVDGASLLTSFMHGMYAAGMWNEPRGQNFTDGGAPFYDTYECADGRYVAVGCMEAKFYAELMRGLDIDLSELPAQLDRSGWPMLRERIADRFRQRSRDEWATTFAASDACVTPVLSPLEAHMHPHNAARHSFVTVAGHTQPAPAPRFSRTPTNRPQPEATDAGAVASLIDRWRNAGPRQIGQRAEPAPPV